MFDDDNKPVTFRMVLGDVNTTYCTGDDKTKRNIFSRKINKMIREGFVGCLVNSKQRLFYPVEKEYHIMIVEVEGLNPSYYAVYDYQELDKNKLLLSDAYELINDGWIKIPPLIVIADNVVMII